MTLDNNGLDGSRIIDPDARELADLLVQAAAGRNVETEILQFLGSGQRLGIDRSELLRQALHRYLVRLRAEDDVEAWLRRPPTADETSLADISDWGPAEDWTDWLDETG